MRPCSLVTKACSSLGIRVERRGPIALRDQPPDDELDALSLARIETMIGKARKPAHEARGHEVVALMRRLKELEDRSPFTARVRRAGVFAAGGQLESRAELPPHRRRKERGAGGRQRQRSGVLAPCFIGASLDLREPLRVVVQEGGKLLHELVAGKAQQHRAPHGRRTIQRVLVRRGRHPRGRR